MIRSIRTAALVSALLFSVFSASSLAQDDAAKNEESEKKSDPSDTIDMTEDVIFERLTGLYFEGRGGVFFTLGGDRGYSNGQPFLGFEIGYDITDALSIQLGYASGYQAANMAETPPENCMGDPGSCDYHLDFGLTFFNLSVDYDVLSYRRCALEVRLGGGVVLIKPSAIPDQSPVDGNAFLGLRFEYYTLLKHFTLGAEVDGFFVFPTMIPALAISFSILYNF